MKRLLSAVLPVVLATVSIANAQTRKGVIMAVKEPLKLSVQESFFVRRTAPGWEKAVPQKAKKINFTFGKSIDLDKVVGKTGKEKDEGVLYVSFNSSGKGVLDFGIGADWWVDVYINGNRCCSTMDTGNGTADYSTANNPFALPVNNGKNLLAIKVRRGSSGWTLVCGPSKYKPFSGTIPWKKGPLPQPLKYSGKSYRLIVLGDLHFDTDEKVYHSDYNEPDARLNKIQRAEFARNAAMWKERNPRMIAAAASQITPGTIAVIQVGDLIQGDCGNPEVHSKMLLDTLRFLKKEFKGLPFLTVTGNHDIRGTGAEQAYMKTMPEYIARELNQNITKTTYYTFFGSDLFLFIDFNKPDIDTIIKAMEQKARYKFVISHGPVLPSTNRHFRWFLYGQSDLWRRITHQLFMRNDVIVLTGHVHDLELTECVTTEGRITQLMANSVWAAADLAKYKTICSQPAEYGKEMTDPDAKKLFGEYKDVITRYWKANGAGYFVLDIAPSGITAKYYGGDSTKPSKEIKLR